MVVSEVDEIAWLFNLRGEGTSQNTVGSHLIVLERGCELIFSSFILCFAGHDALTLLPSSGIGL